MCYFFGLEHIAHYKAKNQNTVKTNSCTHTYKLHTCSHAHTHPHAHMHMRAQMRMHTHTHTHTHARIQNQ